MYSKSQWQETDYYVIVGNRYVSKYYGKGSTVELTIHGGGARYFDDVAEAKKCADDLGGRIHERVTTHITETREVHVI